MRPIIWTIIMFLSVITLTSFVAIADDPDFEMLDLPSESDLRNSKIVKFTDGDITCYMPSTRAGISCIKN